MLRLKLKESSMAYSNELFSEQLDQVKVQFQDLSTTLEEVCENLKGSDSPPASEIMEEIINSANKIFEELKSCVIEWAKSVQLPDIPDAQDLDSIKAITTLSDNIMAHQDRVQGEKVLEYINRARSIIYAKEGESFPPLEDFYKNLDTLEKRVSTSSISEEDQNERTQILENRHPINGVLTLLEHGDELDQESYDQISEIISEQYGHSFMIATVRGSLMPQEIPDPKGPQPQPPPDTEEEPEEPEPKGADDLLVDGQAEVQQEEIPEEPPTVKTQKEPDESETESIDDLLVDGQAEVQQEETSEVTPVVTPEELEKSKLDTSEQIKTEIAVALERRRFGIAYHLARTTPGVLPSFHAVKFIASNYVTDKDSPVNSNLLSGLAYKMRNEVLGILNEKPDSVQHSYAALMTSAALTPALTTHSEPIALLLESLDPHLAGLPSLRTLAQTVVKISRSDINIPVNQLHRGGSFEKWIQEAQDLQKEGKDWIKAERQSSLRFAPATRVWHRILDIWEKENQYSIGHLFELLAESVEKIDIGAITSVAKYWRQNGKREIANIDQKFRPAQSASKPITGDAHKDLLDKITKALDFVDQWNKLLKARPNEAKRYDTTVVNNLRDAVNEHGEKALNEVAKIEKKPLARIAENLIQQYLDKFKKADSQAPDSRLRLWDLLNGDLLADPSIQLDDAGHSRNPDSHERLIRLAQQDDLNFQTGIITRAKEGDFQGAYEALEFVERSRCLDEDNIDNIRTQVDKEYSDVEQDIKDKVSEISNQLDIAYARGILTAEETDTWRDFIPDPATFSQINNSKLFCKDLNEVEELINNANQKRRGEMYERLSSLKKATPKETVARIEDAIQDGRLQVAEDYIDRIEHGDDLLDPYAGPNDRSFDYFFPEFVKKYNDFQQKKSDAITLIRNAIKDRKCVGPVDATQLSPDIVRNGISLIDAWSNLQTEMLTDNVGNALENFLKQLGFKNAVVDRKNNVMNTEVINFRLKIDPIADRSRVQLPDFGSRANGLYQIVTIRSYVTIEPIIQTASKSTGGDLPNIVLFFNFLDEEERRSLAREFSSSDLRPTVVLDNALVSFLAIRPSNKWIGTFFGCASAFTFAQPFDPDAAKVPPEMFFGRKEERKKIVAMAGDMTHFVYGGRRLGKTALLRDIEREYESRRPDQLVFFLNLKSKHPRDWQELFIDKLKEHKVLGANTSRLESMIKGIKNWLDEKKGERRILFLVDEADEFLKADQQANYRVLEQLRELMDDTDRRFKVVFAGLESVQRAVHTPNSPVSKLGDPVRIGPMLPETDPNEIENLIRGPLEALGYRFASDDSLIHIAAETNYYPALAQQFCKNLLHRLGEQRKFVAPPYQISPEVVAEVADSKDTRDRILKLFKLTIELDSKYEFLTYLIAQQSFSDNNTRLKSVHIDDIWEKALQEWPQGFEMDYNSEMFEILLDEMVGLGILRKVRNKEFTIRTRNLRMLLGNDDEIERRLADAKNRSSPPTFHPRLFRRSFSDGSLSSLTTEDEGWLLASHVRFSVGIIFGTCLAGLNRVQKSLEKAETEGSPPTLHDTKVSLLASTLNKVIQARTPGVHIVFVDARGVDNNQLIKLINLALKRSRGLQAQSRTIRIVFLGSPSEAWAWMKSHKSPTAKGNTELKEIWLKPCAKGFAHTWLKGKDAQAALTDLEDSQSVYSSWPIVVEAAAENKMMADATNMALDNGDIVSDVPSVSEVKSVLRILLDWHPEPMTVNMISDPGYVEDENNQVSKEQASLTLDWARRLSIVCKEKNGYRLDTAYAEGLTAIFKQ
ncbi:MAG: AAA family ATPase [Gemmatimonadetes bacterium]|nr:AAA family ATPase [Gemmatimonadota bacterium]